MPVDATQEHRLTTIRAKIERAAKHIIDFYDAKKTFLESSPFTFAHNENVDTGHYDVIIADIKPVPLEFSLIIGDAIHNLRAALDLLACQLVKIQFSARHCNHIYSLSGSIPRRLRRKKGFGACPEVDTIHFPISDSSESFKNALIKPKVKLMSQAALNIITDLQPYKGGKCHDLWMLHRLDIQDKHRLLIVVPTSIYSMQSKSVFIPSSPSRAENRSSETRAAIPEENLFIPKIGDQVGWINPTFISNGIDGEIRSQFRFEGDIAFNEPGIVQNKSALNILRKFASVVEYTINQFEPLFPQ